MGMPPNLRVQVIAEVGDPNDTVAPTLDDAWMTAIFQSQNCADLRVLLVRRHALLMRLAEEQESANITIGQDVVDEQGQFFIHLQTMYDQNQAEILRLLAALSASRAPVTGAISASVFEQPPANYPDANDPAFAGNPYRRYPRWRP